MNPMRIGMLRIALMIGALPPAVAGGTFYNNNQSAEYVRTFDRNSATDNADIAYYNMAGTPMLPLGWTINGSGQIAQQKASVAALDNPVLGNRNDHCSSPALQMPDFFAVYRKDDWAAFCGLEAIGSTGSQTWNGGLPTLDLRARESAGYGQASSSGVIGGDAYANTIAQGGSAAQAQAAATAATLGTGYFPAISSLQISSYYLALRLGGALQVDPDFAVALALRYVKARQELVGGADGFCTYNQYNHNLADHTRSIIDLASTAAGMSLELGLDFHPGPATVINFTYELGTRLDFRVNSHGGEDGGGLYPDPARGRLDLPKVVRLGLGTQLNPRTRLAFGLNAYLEASANQALLNNPGYGVAAGQAFSNSYEESTALEYQLNPRWLLSCGLNLSHSGQHRNATLDVGLAGAQSTSLTEATGCQYRISPKLKLNAGLAHTGFVHPYRQADAGDAQVQAAFLAQGQVITPTKEFNRQALILAIGMDYHF